MWPFDPIIDFSPLLNIVTGAILILAGLVSFGYVPGKWPKLIIGLGLVGGGLLLLLGYVGVW